MDVEQALSRVDRIDDLQWATATEVVLAAEVRRLRERESKARELINTLVELYSADCDIDPVIDHLCRWLETE